MVKTKVRVYFSRRCQHNYSSRQLTFVPPYKCPTEISIIILINMACQKVYKTINTATQFSSEDIYYEEEEQNQRQNPSITPIQKENQLNVDPTRMEPLEESSMEKQPKDDKKCLNHNFQKHTVTTVKKLMRIRYVSEGSEEEKLAFKIWNIFMVSEVKSKKILLILFGCINKQDSRHEALFKKCGFEEIFAENQLLIRKAQQILRKRFIQTVTQQLVWENIKNFRSIKQCQEFCVYFSELLRIIRAGPLIKFRINDKTSKKIRAEIRNKHIQ